MSQSITQWRQVIRDHYHTLDDFDDATTIRTMLRFCKAYVRDKHDVADKICDAYTRDEWLDGFELDIKRVQKVQKELEDWLAKRGLTL